jgi:hypothetical protein
MKREYYSDSIAAFLSASTDTILIQLTKNNDFDLPPSTYRSAPPLKNAQTFPHAEARICR